MDQTTADRMTDLAKNLEKFLDLHPDEQNWLYPMLGRAEKRAIAILQAIQGKHLTYKEIAAETDSHPNTVKQMLYAFEKGGLAYSVGKTGKWTTPIGGRNRKLVVI